MVGERIDREPNDLDAALVELGLDLGHITELGGAHRREVLRVREQHRPLVADPIVKADPAFRGLCLEIRGSIVDCEGHRRPRNISALIASRRAAASPRCLAIWAASPATPKQSAIRSRIYCAVIWLAAASSLGPNRCAVSSWCRRRLLSPLLAIGRVILSSTFLQTSATCRYGILMLHRLPCVS